MSDVVFVALITSGTSLLAAVIGLGGAWAINARTVRLEERKHFRELALKVALVKFESCERLAQQLANATGKLTPVPPLDAFVIDAMKFMDIVSAPGLSARETGRRLAALRDFNKVVRETAQPQRS